MRRCLGTRKRKSGTLREAMTELGLAAATIVTKNEDEQIAVDAWTVEPIPVWRVVSSLPDTAE